MASGEPLVVLHPALVYHVVNSLGWQSFRPLQEAAVEPIVRGEHALLLAPTAGGKTEAAVFPVLSRMIDENWLGLTCLYVAPLRALLNNLEPRLAQYANFVGRRSAVWHGDVGQSARRKLLRDPPDILLTTPESLEAMLVSSRTDAHGLLQGLRTVIVDEIHAFAGDDRGWHVLAVLERLTRIAGRAVQRIGLSATVGRPDELLEWLKGSDAAHGRVVAPSVNGEVSPSVMIDFVGSLDNAATVISRLNRGEKRLVFVDSRARAEELAVGLRQRAVTTFVTHSSLSLDERRLAEQAFAEARDCVIVATSALELGVDVGDLDRVIQIDAPRTVASFLQRLGRTGRRSGLSRNCLFLATRDQTLVQIGSLMHLWEGGYVEPVVPPSRPLHIVAQQIMALILQEGRIGRRLWPDWFGGTKPFCLSEDTEKIVDWMIESGILVDDQGMLSLGNEAESRYGRRHFLDLLSVFTSEPLFTVYWGRKEIGKIDGVSFQRRTDEPILILLAGRTWLVTGIDWDRRHALVEPAEGVGRSRWGSQGPSLSYQVCQGMAAVLAGETPKVDWSQRADARLGDLRSDFVWVAPEQTALVKNATGEMRWWTFAGARANAVLAEMLGQLASTSSPSDLFIPVTEGVTAEELRASIGQMVEYPRERSSVAVAPKALASLKFNECIPAALGLEILGERVFDREAVNLILSAPLSLVHSG